MAESQIITDLFNEAASPVTISLGRDTSLQWHEITVSIFDDVGAPASDPITGTISGEVRKKGADRFQAFVQSLNLATGDRSWDPELSTAEEYRFTVAGLNANYQYQFTILSWSQ